MTRSSAVHRPVTRSMSGPVTRSASRAGGRRARSSANHRDLDLSCKRSRPAKLKRSDRTSISVEHDGSPSEGARPPKACPHFYQRGPPIGDQAQERLEIALHEIADLTNMINELKANAAKAPLKNLEEYFTCPLCFDIMACPYSLHARHCGHTFCATCILKWFFSHLHRGCGGWHESVGCPLCRSPLYCPPDLPPRPDFTFPFIPNRALDTALQGLISNLTHFTMADWCEGGHARQEWLKRDRTGRTEMTHLATQWARFQPTDFVEIKSRLEV